MGKTAFSGPVYGAKGALWNPFTLVVSSGASTQVAATTRVPAYEDWYATEDASAPSAAVEQLEH